MGINKLKVGDKIRVSSFMNDKLDGWWYNPDMDEELDKVHIIRRIYPGSVYIKRTIENKNEDGEDKDDYWCWSERFIEKVDIYDIKYFKDNLLSLILKEIPNEE